MTSTSLSPCLYTKCSSYWKRPFTPCSPCQIQPGCILNAVFLWHSPWSLKSSKAPMSPASVCVALQPFDDDCSLSELIWMSFSCLPPKELWFRYLPWMWFQKYRVWGCWRRKGGWKQVRQRVECGSHGLIIYTSSEPMRSLGREEKEKTRNLNFKKNLINSCPTTWNHATIECLVCTCGQALSRHWERMQRRQHLPFRKLQCLLSPGEVQGWLSCSSFCQGSKSLRWNRTRSIE